MKNNRQLSKVEKDFHLDIIAKYRDNLRIVPNLKQMFIEMTLNCNEHCRHCGSNCGDVKMENQLTDQEILDMLATLKTRVEHLPFLNITGGEPLLRPNFYELMTKIHEMGYHWGMTSNGVLITKEVAKKLKNAGMYSVSISLDGLKETHEWFRNSKGSYNKTIQDIYKVVKELGVDSWRVINVEPIGRALTDDEIRLESKDYKYIIDFIMEKRKSDKEMDVAFGCNHYLGIKRELETRPWFFMCTAGITTAGIFYNGDIAACLDIDRRPETIQGNVRTDDLYDTWINKFEVFRQDKTKDSKKCSTCKHNRYCGGGGYHTWDAENKKPKLCMIEEIKKAKKEEKSSKKENKKNNKKEKSKKKK